MEREELKQHLDTASWHAMWVSSSENLSTQERATLSIAHSLVVIATLLDQIVGRDGLSVGTVRTESGY